MLSHPELLDRVFEPFSGALSAELAHQILNVSFPATDHIRYEELSAKAQDGKLSPDEQDELDDYLNLNDFLVILKAKASTSLGANGSAA
jgi:hypothetical protein